MSIRRMSLSRRRSLIASAAFASLAALSPSSAQAITVFGNSSFNGATNSDHTFSNGLVNVDFDYDRANGMNANVERIDGGTFFDQVREERSGRRTTFTFSQLVTSFSGLWNLSYRSDGTFRTGNADGLVVRAFRGNTRVFEGCLVGGNVDDDDVGTCTRVNEQTESAIYGISGVSFNRVTIGLFDGETEAYTLSNLTVTTAVPEPRSHLLLLAGLGAIAFIARRRRND